MRGSSRWGYFNNDGLETSLPAPVPLGPGLDLSATTALSFDNLVIAVGDDLAELAADIGLIGHNQEGTLPFMATTSQPMHRKRPATPS